MNRVSKKTRSKAAERAACRERVLYRERGVCQARIVSICTITATEVHEVWTRGRGGDKTNEDHCLALCSQCHGYVTRQSGWALAWGFTIHHPPAGSDGRSELLAAAVMRASWEAAGRPLAPRWAVTREGGF